VVLIGVVRGGLQIKGGKVVATVDVRGTGGGSTVSGGSRGVSGGGGGGGTVTRAPTREQTAKEIIEAWRKEERPTYSSLRERAEKVIKERGGGKVEAYTKELATTLKQQQAKEETIRQQAIREQKEEARKKLIAEKTKEIIEREQKITELKGYLELEAVQRHPKTIATIQKQIERVEREKAVFEKQQILKTARKEWEKTKGAGKPSFEVMLGEKTTTITYPRSKEYINIQTARAGILSRKLQAQKIIERQKEPTPEYVILKAGVEQGKVNLEEYQKIATRPTGKILPSFTVPKIQLFGTTKDKFLIETEPKEVYLPETKISLGYGRDITLFKPKVEKEYILPYGERLKLESKIVEPYKELWTQKGIDTKKGFKRLGSIITSPKESIRAEKELATAGIYKAKLEGKKTDIGIKSAIYRPVLYARENPIEAVILPFTIGYGGRIVAGANVPNITAKVSKASKVLIGTFVVSETAKLSLKYLKEPVYYSGVSGKIKLLIEPATKVSFAVLGYSVAGKYKAYKWQQEQAKFIKSKTGEAWQYQQKEAPLVVERETGAIIKTKQLQITPKKIDYYGGSLTYAKQLPKLSIKSLKYGFNDYLGKWVYRPATGSPPQFITTTTKQTQLIYKVPKYGVTEKGFLVKTGYKSVDLYNFGIPPKKEILSRLRHLYEEEEELASLYQEWIHRGAGLFDKFKGDIFTPPTKGGADISIITKQQQIKNLLIPSSLISKGKQILEPELDIYTKQEEITPPKLATIPKIKLIEEQEKEGVIVSTALGLGEKTETIQAPKRALIQELKIEIEQETEDIEIPPDPIRPKVRIEEPIDERIITPELFRIGGGVKPTKAKPLFNVYAKERGRFIKVNKEALPRNKALNLGGDVVDNTASATFKLTRADKKGKMMDDLGFYKKSKFRQKNGLYVEMNKNRIDTLGEIQGITVKGWLAQRGGLRLGGGL